MNSSVLCCATLNIAPGIERSIDSIFLRKLSANLLYQVFVFDVFGAKVELWICSKGLLELVLFVSARDQLFHFLSGSSVTNIHYSKDSWEGGGYFLVLTTTSTNAENIAGRLLQSVYLCT